MIRKTLIATVVTAGLTIALASPANATGSSGGRTSTSSGGTTHTHYCNCGHSAGSSACGSTTSGGTTTTSGGTTTTSGGTTTTSGGTTTTSGGTTTSSSSGGTAVPEPGMLGMMGMGLVALAYARRRKTRTA